jgi:hypothetical protein
MRESFVFYGSFYEAIKELPEPAQLELYGAICEYALYDNEPDYLSAISKAMFALMKPNIDKAAARYQKNIENGKKGGRPKTQTEPNQNPTETQPKPTENPTKTQTEPKANLNEDVYVNVDEYVNVDVNVYGEYSNVFLLPTEVETLKAEFPNWEEWVEKLSGYIKQTGKQYNSHFATIRNWARKAKKEEPTEKSYSLDEWVKIINEKNGL